MRGFKVLVDKGYIHRDIKPANVLVSNQIHKVADFGFACKADILGKKKLNDICGTPLYMAPQLLKNQPYSAKSDIWSLGLMLYEMVFGYTPWPCRSIQEYLKNITTQPLKFPFDGKIGKNTKDFIEKSLVVDENKRISWKEVFEHPLIKHNNTGQ
jgi:calcium-dependent protein kinase